jgi:thiosulfate dehydrogenase
MKHRNQQGMAAIVLVCGVVGAAIVAGTLWQAREQTPTRASARVAGDEDYGRHLIERTTEFLGPDVSDASKRYSGNRLACASCHINAGVEPGSLSLATAVERYPRQSPRSGTKETIEERINGCMTRSMAGRRLPEDSSEMKAMVAYLNRLAIENAATGASRLKAQDPKDFKTPMRKADLKAGEQVFAKRCAACHQGDGQGLPASADLRDGFVLPPLWGPNSFNDGAGMHRVITAAKFIKAKMPLGSANLTDEEALDVSAFINSKPRPQMAHLDEDYPDKTKKPVDAGFGPFADPFPLDQHRFGPFAPIEAYYKNLPKKK